MAFNKIKYLLLTFIIFMTSCIQAKTLDEKIGQMIVIGFNGDSIHSKHYKKVLKKIENGEISGVILFKKNIKSKEDLINMNEKILSSNTIVPFVAIDNEGGFIQRHDFIKSPSAFEISNMEENKAHQEYKKMADFLSEIKINFNFAPVVDLGINEKSIIVKKQRSYSKNPIVVSKYAEILIEEHSKNNILTSMKHFPGHGSVVGDTHKGFVDATKTFKQDELKPYQNILNKYKTNTIMVSHIFNSDFDNEYPASLSKKTIKDLLIDKMGYKGLIVSDDYDMGAIRKNYSFDDIVVNSINSGVDIMLFSNNLDYYDINIDKKIRKIVKKNIKTGKIKIEDIDNSYNKIIKTKELLNRML